VPTLDSPKAPEDLNLQDNWDIKWKPKLGDLGSLGKDLNDALKSGKALSTASLGQIVGKVQHQLENQITDAGKAYLSQIESQLKEWGDAVNPNEIKKKILRKAEEFCEAYLKDKLDFLPSIGLKGVPKVQLNFSIPLIEATIQIYILQNDADENAYEQNWMVLMEVSLKQDISKLEVPSFTPVIRPNPNFAQDKLDEVKRQLEAKKDELIREVFMKILQDYIPPLRAINEAVKLFG
jgi:hypothetical protein